MEASGGLSNSGRLTRISVETSGLVPKVLERNMPRFLRGGYLAAARHWHEVYRPLHFTAAAWVRYGYVRRALKYTRYKLRKQGHELPLVWSGDSRDRTGRDFRITSNTTGARVRMRAARLNVKGNWRRDTLGGGAVRWSGPRKEVVMREELVRVNPQEQRNLVKVVIAGLVATAQEFGLSQAKKQIARAKSRTGSRRAG